MNVPHQGPNRFWRYWNPAEGNALSIKTAGRVVSCGMLSSDAIAYVSSVEPGLSYECCGLVSLTCGVDNNEVVQMSQTHYLERGLMLGVHGSLALLCLAECVR